MDRKDDIYLCIVTVLYSNLYHLNLGLVGDVCVCVCVCVCGGGGGGGWRGV